MARAPRRRVRLDDLRPEHRRVIKQTAAEEITRFGADGDPKAIERLAAAGRLTDWPTDEGRILANLVSATQVEIAARLRQARAILPLFGGLGWAHKLAVRELSASSLTKRGDMAQGLRRPGGVTTSMAASNRQP